MSSVGSLLVSSKQDILKYNPFSDTVWIPIPLQIGKTSPLFHSGEMPLDFVLRTTDIFFYLDITCYSEPAAPMNRVPTAVLPLVQRCALIMCTAPWCGCLSWRDIDHSSVSTGIPSTNPNLHTKRRELHMIDIGRVGTIAKLHVASVLISVSLGLDTVVDKNPLPRDTGHFALLQDDNHCWSRGGGGAEASARYVESKVHLYYW